MNNLPFVSTPWDALVFGMPTYEIPELDESLLALATANPGHYTIKVNPLASKALLHRHGFYYCDTLLVPVVRKADFTGQFDGRVGIDRSTGIDALADICRDTFAYGRFHRDFNLPSDAADQRYINWLHQLSRDKEVFGLTWEDSLAAFFACDGNRILLHAVAENFRGLGLAKHLWARACEELFSCGHDQLQSSVSAANLAVINLYASLGFRFREVTDIYHRLTL
jgi:GNAT superfamily N-acetyltransferase